MSSSLGEGVFLRLDPAEAAVIFRACDESGLERDGEGVKALLLSLMEEEESPDPESPAEVIADWISKNPEKVAAAKLATETLAKTLLKKVMK